MQALESLTETQVRGSMPGNDGGRGGCVCGGIAATLLVFPSQKALVFSACSLRFHLQQGLGALRVVPGAGTVILCSAERREAPRRSAHSPNKPGAGGGSGAGR